MAWDGHESVLFGGLGKQSDGCSVNGTGLLNDTWIWNGSAWQSCSSLGGCTATQPQARESFGLALDSANDASGGKLLMFGGNEGLPTDVALPDELQPAASSAQDTWAWNSTTKDWTKVSASGPCKRNSAAMDYDPGRHRVLLFGGQGDISCGSAGPLNDTWTWTGTSWEQCGSCNPVSAPISDRTGHRLAFDNNVGNVVLFGGSSNSADGTWCSSFDNDLLCKDTWYIDGGPWNQKIPTMDSPAQRCCGGVAYDPGRNQLVMFGGGTFNHASCDDTWIWDGTNWNPEGGTCPTP
jgi:hypothetical protein